VATRRVREVAHGANVGEALERKCKMLLVFQGECDHHQVEWLHVEVTFEILMEPNLVRLQFGMRGNGVKDGGFNRVLHGFSFRCALFFLKASQALINESREA
jgi:hypothetical protein